MKLLKMRRNLAIAAFSAFALPLYAQSPYSSLQVPKQIQYQGRVATATGGAWSNTEGYFSFALVQGATVLWNNWEGTSSPSDPGAVSLGAGQVLTLPVSSGVFSVRLGEGSDTNEQIPPTVFFDTVANSVRTGVKLAVWFSPSGSPPFTRLSPDVDFTSVPFSMVAGIAETVKERALTTAMLADGAVVSAKIADGSIAAADFVSTVQQSLTPPGTIVAFGGPTANISPGWRLCDGSALKSLDFPNLYAAIEKSWGDGSTSPTGAQSSFAAGVTNFNLPDLRGQFLRGVDGVNGRDPDKANRAAPASGGNSANAVGSVQDHALQDHGHQYSVSGANAFGVLGANPAGAIRLNVSTGSASFFWQNSADKSVYDANKATETRPVNAYVNYIIKY